MLENNGEWYKGVPARRFSRIRERDQTSTDPGEEQETKLRMALKLPRDEHFAKLLQELPKIESKPREGQKVEVYRDSTARPDIEGIAVLRAFTGIVNGPLEWWLVQFEKGDETFRWIDTNQPSAN